MTEHHWQRELPAMVTSLADLAESVPLDLLAAVDALLGGDVAAAAVLQERSRRVDRTTRSVEKEAQRLILLQQPMASDFRRLMAVLRIAVGVDRAERLVSHVALLTPSLAAERLPDQVVASIRSVSSDVAALYETAVRSFRAGDAETAALVPRGDDHVDAGCRELRATAIASFGETGGPTDTVMDLGLRCRYLERVGDHAVALAENTVYVVTGEEPPG